jgi:cell division protein DivIC
MLSRLPKFTKNFYFLFLFFFLIWMLFFDANDFVTQVKLSSKKGELEDEKEYYLEKIEEVKEERKELLTNPKLLEKFAREKYIMKKPTEDVFIVIDENIED